MLHKARLYSLALRGLLCHNDEDDAMRCDEVGIPGHGREDIPSQSHFSVLNHNNNNNNLH